MSKKKFEQGLNNMQRRDNPVNPANPEQPVVKPPETEESKRRYKIRKHRRCPICWEGRGGAGITLWSKPKGGNAVKTCYQCDQCGHIWPVVYETVRRIIMIDNRPVQVDHDDIQDLEER